MSAEIWLWVCHPCRLEFAAAEEDGGKLPHCPECKARVYARLVNPPPPRWRRKGAKKLTGDGDGAP